MLSKDLFDVEIDITLLGSGKVQDGEARSSSNHANSIQCQELIVHILVNKRSQNVHVTEVPMPHHGGIAILRVFLMNGLTIFVILRM
jgi:hypothetical protein